jgi:septation ring formation regulator EzrA
MELKQLDRMEDMLTNLIKIVGTLSNDFQVMKQELQDVKKDVEEVKKEQAVTNRILTDMRADQDHIWEKAAKNERELAKLKRHLQL